MGRGKRVEKVLSTLPEPGEGQTIVRVVATPGGNIVNVQDALGADFLCRVPSKFKNIVWIRKGAPARICAVLCSCAS